MNERYLGNNLVEVLQHRATHEGDKTAFIFLAGGEHESGSLTFRELDAHAQTIAITLLQNAKPGDRALLVYPSGLDYVAAFFGCLYAGIIPVPVYPPRANGNLGRLLSIWSDCQASLLLSNDDFSLPTKDPRVPRDWQSSFHLIKTDKLIPNGRPSAHWQKPEITGDTIAFLQYTSGSTAAPKGVMVSHGNLMHNLKAIQDVFGLDEKSVLVSWLPIYHDMGLIGTVLTAPYINAPCILMSPADFIQQPARWLEAFFKYKGVAGVAPNFAYDLCIRRASAEQLTKMDLSNWSVAINGAEPIRADTVRRFVETFEPCGIPKAAPRPAYGLAEATLLVSAAAKDAIPVVKAFDADSLSQDRVVEFPEACSDSRSLVGCGPGLPDQQISVVNPDTLMECSPGQVGEIWIKGPSVAQGYWNKPELTKAIFHAFIAGTGKGPFLRTGDLGFLHQGELYITGRHKDLIIVNGRNHYPQDIEFTAEQSHPALRPGCGAAFSISEEQGERIVVVYELDRVRARGLDLDEVADCIRRAVAEEHELEVHNVVFLKPAAIPKTSSGKIQRSLCRKKFLAGELEQFREPKPKASSPAFHPPHSEPAFKANHQPMQFSLFYFASDEAGIQRNKYRMLLEGARFADEHDFAAVWVPERHFHAFGGLYPNPSVLASALAVLTKRVRIRAGSVVLPLHHPIRVAEEWSVVDNLSDGRVDLAFARGWNANDFVLAPSNYSESLKVMHENAEVVRKLWRGGSISVPNGKGEETQVRIHPRPLQPDLNLWLTCSGGADRFTEAGAAGANVLTALLFQSVDELAEKISAYRQARLRAGYDPGAGHVTLMMHTFLGIDPEEVKQKVHAPFIEYLKTSVDLWSNGSEDLRNLTEDQAREVLNMAFERYYQTSGLFGAPETCLEMIRKLKQAGVDEIACLIDFGLETEDVLKGLHALHWLQEKARVSSVTQEASRSVAAAAAGGGGELRGVVVGRTPELIPSAPALARSHELCHPPGAYTPENQVLLSLVQQTIIGVISKVTELRPEIITAGKHFLTLGINSLKGAEILGTIQNQFDLQLPHSVLFEFSTVDRLAEMLVREHKDHLTEHLMGCVGPKLL